MSCLGLEPGADGWLAQMNPLSHDVRVNKDKIINDVCI